MGDPVTKVPTNVRKAEGPVVKSLFKTLATFGIVAALSTAAATTVAQETASEPGKGAEAATSKRTKREAKAPPKVQELEALVIEGRIQKPEVFYVLGRTDARYSGRELKQSFVGKVLKSVKDNPF